MGAILEWYLVIIGLVTIQVFEFYYHLSFQVLLLFKFLRVFFNVIWVVTLWVLEFCHHLGLWVLLLIEFLSFFSSLKFGLNFILKIFSLLHYFSFWVLSDFEIVSCINLSFQVLKILVVSQLELLSLVTISVFGFPHSSSWVFFSSQKLSFVTIWGFECSHNLSDYCHYYNKCHNCQ